MNITFYLKQVDMKTLLNYKATLALLTLSVIFFFLGLWVYTEFIAYAGALFATAIGLTILLYADGIMLNGLDTKIEIEKGNIAYAIYVLSVAIVISVSFGSAFFVFIALK